MNVAARKRNFFARFDHDEQGRLVMRMRSAQLYVSTAIAVCSLAGTITAAAAYMVRPYLVSVATSAMAPEVHRLEGSMQSLQRGLDDRITRREYEQAQQEILNRLDLIAGEIRRVDERIQTQSDRTDALYSGLMRTLQGQR